MKLWWELGSLVVQGWLTETPKMIVQSRAPLRTRVACDLISLQTRLSASSPSCTKSGFLIHGFASIGIIGSQRRDNTSQRGPPSPPASEPNSATHHAKLATEIDSQSTLQPNLCFDNTIANSNADSDSIQSQTSRTPIRLLIAQSSGLRYPESEKRSERDTDHRLAPGFLPVIPRARRVDESHHGFDPSQQPSEWLRWACERSCLLRSQEQALLRHPLYHRHSYAR